MPALRRRQPFRRRSRHGADPEPVFRCVESVPDLPRPLFLLAPGGRLFDQAVATELAEHCAGGFSLLCGRYEGVDQRVADHLVDDELSVGDFVLAGGELAALVVVEAVARLLPDVLGTTRPPVTRASPRVCSNTPSTPGRRNSGDGGSPRCSVRGTTGRWPPGVAPRRSCGRPNAARI